MRQGWKFDPVCLCEKNVFAQESQGDSDSYPPFVGVSIIFCLYSTGVDDVFPLRPVQCDIADIMPFEGSTRQ